MPHSAPTSTPTAAAKATSTAATAAGPLLAAGILLIAMNLRPGVVSVSPELDTIRHSTGLSGSLAGLLTTLPILCFGLLAPFAAKLSRRIGMTRALGAMMALLTAGIALRLAPGLPALFAGTVLIGAAISLSNVLVPSVIKRNFERRTGLMMGLYSVALFCGAALAAGVTVPLGDALGLGWRGAIGVWAVLSALAFALWLPQLRRSDAPPAMAPGAADSRTPLRRSPLAWKITLLMGLQSLQYYACAAWIPAMLTSEGMDGTQAGWMLSVMSLAGIAGSLAFTALVGRASNQVALALTGTLLVLGSVLGLLVAPVGGAYAWMLMQGFGCGLLISTALAVIVLRSPTRRAPRRCPAWRRAWAICSPPRAVPPRRAARRDGWLDGAAGDARGAVRADGARGRGRGAGPPAGGVNCPSARWSAECSAE